ncbi:MAG TPA: AlkA N-terminal domain-containing protein [Acidimicrobiales bacterium]|nr:AlkA N-terminal domain-containing protein [Acidimicrobiales bacterium]
MLDEERCYRAVHSRDPRFDGWFYTAVVTTGIYCRPSCPATTPRRANVRFFPTAAAAHGAGFRACKRCRPDAAPGSPEWNVRADVVGRAMRLIADGTVDREGVKGLAGRLGYSERHLDRLLVAEVGAGPLALARAQRAQTARVLLETTALPVADTAFAAGFASVRQFNDTIRQVFARTPTGLRAGRPQQGRHPAPGTLTVRLAYRPPLAAAPLFGFLAARAVPGVEAGGTTSFRRTLTLPRGGGAVVLEADEGHVRCHLRLDDLRDLGAAVARSRRLLDLDADPAAVDGQLGADPHLGALVAARPGLRMPGAVDGAETVLRAVLGQQVSVASARTLAGAIARRHGEPVGAAVEGLSLRFPPPQVLSEVDPATLPLPRARAQTLVRLARLLASGEVVLGPEADRDEIGARLLGVRGIGPWTVAYVRARALGDPDAFLPTDLGVRRALRRWGHPDDVRAVRERAEGWRPWRSYALHHLWASLEPGANRKVPS